MFAKANSKLIVPILLLVFLTCLFISVASAQKDSKSGGSKAVTGCLQKGDEADEFSLTADDGSVYGLRSSSVKLGEHVGHKVTVSGKFKAEDYEKDKDENKESGKKEAGDIQVSSLKMVSASCQ